MTSRFELFSTPLPGLNVLQRKPIGDDRGFLERLYCAEEMKALGLSKSIVQVNHTLTKKRGMVRGMHFQYPPHMETKIVSCLKGEVFDVAVDLRHGSDTFMQWHGEILSADNCKTLLVPEGFAHGFQTLTAECEMLYFHTAPYVPSSEGGLHPGDPFLNIRWLLTIEELSPRDSGHPYLTDKFEGISV